MTKEERQVMQSALFALEEIANQKYKPRTNGEKAKIIAKYYVPRLQKCLDKNDAITAKANFEVLKEVVTDEIKKQVCRINEKKDREYYD